jgi:hypothetical protein
MAKIIVHGYKESYLFNKDVKIYKGNEFVGAVKHHSLFILDAEEGDVMIFKVGSKQAAVIIENGVNDVSLKLSRWTGELSAHMSGGISTDIKGYTPTAMGSKNKNNLIFLAGFFGVIGCFLLFGWYQDHNEKEKLKEIYDRDNIIAVPPVLPPEPDKDGGLSRTSKREGMCMTCNGTTVVPAGYAVVTGKFGSKDCFSKHFDQTHVCDIIMCPTCHQSHCKTLDIHKRCEACEGTGRAKPLRLP